MFKTLSKTVAIAMVAAIGALSLPADAFAGDRRGGYYGHGHGKHYYKQRRHSGYHHRKRKRSNDAGVAIAAGVIGLTVGTLIANSANRPHYQPRQVYRQPQPVYRQHRQVYHQPRQVYRQPVQHYAAPQPYTGEWYRYCAGKYRSFDAQSGTFLSYSGVRKLCR